MIDFCTLTLMAAHVSGPLGNRSILFRLTLQTLINP